MRTLIKAGLRSHRGTLLGVAALLALVALSLCTVLTVWLGSQRYVRGEMARLGYGDLTAWVSDLVDAQPLAAELAALDEVAFVGVQPLIFSEYEVGEQESDSEGQLITYEPELYPYRFFQMTFPAMGARLLPSRRGRCTRPRPWPRCSVCMRGTRSPFPSRAAA